MRSAVASLGIHAFAKVWPVGIRLTLNNLRPINSPDDFRGLKIRTPDDPAEVSLFQAFGASPTPSIPGNEMYTALQTHLVDGIDLPIESIEAYKMYEVQKYASYTNHAYVGETLIANNDAWQRLPEKLQSVVAGNFESAALAYRKVLNALEASMEVTLRGKGITFNHPSTSFAGFRAVISRAGIYSRLRDYYGAEIWDLLERAVGKLG